MDQRIEELVSQLSLEEKVSLAAGSGPWHTHGIERLGIPRLKVTDGPNGARGDGRSGASAVCFPVGSALASSWNVDLMTQVGIALGEEVMSKGAQLLLGPTINIHRSPLAGRNFECYSEDPLLTARLAVAFIDGVQSTGVGACAKHFVCNDSEFQRHTISSEVDERTMREIYLVPFEAAVTEADVWSVMAAYNRVNGTYACAHHRLLTEVLKDEWGFEGFVVSDWGAVMDTVETANAGTDLEMPGPPRHLGVALIDAVKAGAVEESVIDEKARRIIRWAGRSGRLGEPDTDEPERSVDTPAQRALARQAAAEGMVLLKNEGVLPLDTSALRRVAVIGPNASPGQIQGGGSSGVKAHYAVSPLDGVRDRLGDGVEVVHAEGGRTDKFTPDIDPALFTALEGEEQRGIEVSYFDSVDLDGEVVSRRNVRQVNVRFFGDVPGVANPRHFSARWIGTFVPTSSGRHVFGLLAAGRSRLLVDGAEIVDNWSDPKPGDAFFGGASREERGSVELEAGKAVRLEVEYSRGGDRRMTALGTGQMAGIRLGLLPPAEGDAVEEAVALAAGADAAIVVVGLTADWETEGYDRGDMSLPGRQAELVRRVAAANPNTVVVVNAGSPVEMEWLDDVPALLWAWYPGQEFGNALAALLTGDTNPSGRLPTTFPRRLEDTPSYLDYPGARGKVRYSEGVFVGYRWFDRRNIFPLFPFGYGLSYTSFAFGEPEVIGTGPDEVTVKVEVTNTGKRTGKEVVQLYVRDVEATVVRPDKELKAFAKVALDPGESRTVSLNLDRRSFAFWDEDTAGWVVERGMFELLIGASSRDIRGRATWELT